MVAERGREEQQRMCGQERMLPVLPILYSG